MILNVFFKVPVLWVHNHSNLLQLHLRANLSGLQGLWCKIKLTWKLVWMDNIQRPHIVGKFKFKMVP